MRTQVGQSKASRLAPFLLLGLVCLVLPVIHIWLQSRLPSDGARIDKLLNTWTPEGVHLHVYDPARAGLQDGDLLTAINGASLDQLASRLLRNPQSITGPSVYSLPEGLVYHLQREGESLDVMVTRGPQPVLAILRGHWGVLLFTVVFQILSLFLLIRRPREPAAGAMFLWGYACSHFYIWSFYLQVPDLLTPLHFWYYILASEFLWWGSWAASIHLALTFPKPLPAVQRRPVLLGLPYLVILSLAGLLLAANWKLSSSYFQWFKTLQRIEGLGSALIFFISLGIILYQYIRTSDLTNRRKIRLVVLSAAIAGGITVSLYLIPMSLGLPVVDTNLIAVVMLLFPASIATAIWRYQLFDIDMVIRRTAGYTLLTVILALVYLVGVVGLQSLFGLLSGRAGESPAAIVVSTLMIAALFNPLRRRIQAGIDRRFYRRQYDMEQILERFAAGLRNEVDLDEVSSSLLSVVKTTVQPEFSSLWLFKEKT